MNRTLELLAHIECFNHMGILETQFKTASEERLETISELCDYFNDEVSYMAEDSE